MNHISKPLFQVDNIRPLYQNLGLIHIFQTHLETESYLRASISLKGSFNCNSVSYSPWHWVFSTLESHTHPEIHESHPRYGLTPTRRLNLMNTRVSLILRSMSLIHNTVSHSPWDCVLWTLEPWDSWVSFKTQFHTHPENESYQHLSLNDPEIAEVSSTTRSHI